MGNELDGGAQFARPMITSSTPAISVATVESVDAVLLNDAVDDDDERAGRTTDLDPRSAECGK